MHLKRCLSSLIVQSAPAHEIIVVYRQDEFETEAALSDFTADGSLPLVFAHPSTQGVIAALNAGLDRATGEIIAITDDDAVPRKDWLARIAAHFLEDPTLAGVGGRDVLHNDGWLVMGEQETVGKLQWFGRAIGSHHLGAGLAREVDILKGVNMSYRKRAIQGLRFDTRLKGHGAQVHYELAFCFALRRAGGKLLYDPEIVVDHFLAPREGADQRNTTFNFEALNNEAHNETFAVLEHLSPLRRIVFLIWAVSIGTRATPGFVQGVRIRLLGLSHPFQRTCAALYGRWLGWRTWRQSRRSGLR